MTPRRHQAIGQAPGLVSRQERLLPLPAMAGPDG
jgi:hypothetical protein